MKPLPILVFAIGAAIVINAILRQRVSEEVAAVILENVRKTPANRKAAKAAGDAFAASLGATGTIRLVAGQLGAT